MTDIDNKLEYLSKKIKTNDYNSEHKLQMIHVFDELLYITNTIWCDNENCETEIHKTDAIYQKIAWLHCYFCCETCEGSGSWSIRYDIRKKKIQKR